MGARIAYITRYNAGRTRRYVFENGAVAVVQRGGADRRCTVTPPCFAGVPVAVVVRPQLIAQALREARA